MAGITVIPTSWAIKWREKIMKLRLYNKSKVWIVYPERNWVVTIRKNPLTPGMALMGGSAISPGRWTWSRSDPELTRSQVQLVEGTVRGCGDFRPRHWMFGENHLQSGSGGGVATALPHPTPGGGMPLPFTCGTGSSPPPRRPSVLTRPDCVWHWCHRTLPCSTGFVSEVIRGCNMLFGKLLKYEFL